MPYDTVYDVKTLGERLQHAMRLRQTGANQVDIAIGKKGHGYTSRLAKRKRPDAAEIHKIADFLKVRYEWLHFGRGRCSSRSNRSSSSRPKTSWRRSEPSDR